MRLYRSVSNVHRLGFSFLAVLISAVVFSAVPARPALADISAGDAAAGGCAGDCNHDGQVTVDELTIGVNIALGTAPLDLCPSFDSDGSGTVTVSDIGAAVNNALNGCSQSTCGNCPAPYACGTANGIPACRAPSGIPLFNHVFVIVMENTSWEALQQSNVTPYLQGLASTAAFAEDFHGIAHPSLPNYLAMTSGDDGGVACGCRPVGDTCSPANCNLDAADCGCAQTRPNLADLLEAAGRNWKGYGEDMGSPCNLNDSGLYAARHMPFLYYDSVQSNPARCQAHVVDYGAFAGDLAGNTPDFVYVAPNLMDDMHDPFPPGPSNLAHGDSWLAAHVPQILASPAYRQNGALFIVWDEDDSTDGSGDKPIPFFLLSPLAKQNGYASAIRADHYSLLATWEDGLGVPRLGRSATAAPLTDFFPGQ